MTTSKGAPKNASKYSNQTTIEELLEDSKLSLGAIDILRPTRFFKRNWVDNVGDLRLLHKEQELSTLVEVSDALLKWLTSECEKNFVILDSHFLREFRYNTDFDHNGILYYLGSLNSNVWENPAITGVVKVRMSSIMHDSQPPYAMIGRQIVRCVTKPEKNSYVVIDFSPRQIKPTHYTLRHYSTWDTEALRSWRLEGAALGQNQWEVLSNHRNDASLNLKGASNTWKLSNISKYYARFRIFQTDFNSNRHYYLSCSGFEIYGSLRDVKSNATGSSGQTSLTFMHMSDFDTNGILYWLGTSRKTQGWQNPALRGLCRVVMSSISKDSQPSHYVVGHDTVRCVTEPKKLSWIMIDLKSVKVVPTHYSVRHYSSFDTECLRNWRFGASNNSTTGSDGHWLTLITHRNDCSLNQKGGMHTWTIPAHGVKDQAFSKFRLFQFGVNSNQHHYLACSGFELYGTVTEGQEAAQVEEARPQGAIRTFKQSFDLDTNGLMYFLGVSGGTSNWQNPAKRGFVTVSSSSLMSDSQPLSCLVGRSAVRTVTKPHQRSWMALNLGDVRIRLTNYTLRHYNSWDTEALRYWNLEGSNDGQAWMPIRQHVDDRALRKAGMAHTWAVDCNHFYSHFRLFMTGRNSNNHWYLACSGIELYGDACGGLVSQHSLAVIKSAVQASNVPFGAPPPPNMMQNQARPYQMQSASPRKQSQAETFKWVQDLDNNGLIYYLGTKCNTAAWQNPAQPGLANDLVAVKTSGLMHDSAPVFAFIGRQSVRAVTRPQKQAWVIIDFKQYAVCPTHYTIRHYSSWDTEALRNWRFEASLDCERWTVLLEHRNDESLHLKGQPHTWKLATELHYSKYRVFQFDKNSNQHYYLSMSGFEIYGSVVRQHSLIQWDSWPRNKSKRLSVDAIQNTVSNDGSDDTWQTCKARQPLNFSSSATQEFSVLVERAENTTNQWKFMVGLAPANFICTGSRQWLGSQQSYAYIGGTGGKCFNASKSVPYGQRWGNKAGDLITCLASRTGTIEFIKNGKSQGIAYTNFNVVTPMFPAVSLTATNARIRLVERVRPSTGLPGMVPMPVPNVNVNQFAQNMQPQLNNQFQQMNMNMAQNMAQNMNNPYQQQRMPNMNVGVGLGNLNMAPPVWNIASKSPHLNVGPDPTSVTNTGSNDTWQGIVGTIQWASGQHYFEVQIVTDTKTSNSWKFIVGVAPLPFNPKRTAWLGSQGSWGYIGGTGGKCHNEGKSVAYGQRFDHNDRIRVNLDFNRSTIAFSKNGKSQGIAYRNLSGAVTPALSLTGKGAVIRLCDYA